ncbi:MAG: hypothetical protein NTZ05_18470 [Chloroflexi bacterium]|nr:hypothetical protein [Chloroflexota bacterium]
MTSSQQQQQQLRPAFRQNMADMLNGAPVPQTSLFGRYREVLLQTALQRRQAAAMTPDVAPSHRESPATPLPATDPDVRFREERRRRAAGNYE